MSMCNIVDIRILICNQEPEYSKSIKKTLLSIGLKEIHTADSHKKIHSLCKSHVFDLVLIDTNFNDTGGFYAGEQLLKKFPNIFILYITDNKNITDAVRSIFSGAVTFIIKNNSKDLENKVTLWSDVAVNFKTVREILNGRTSSSQKLYA